MKYACTLRVLAPLSVALSIGAAAQSLNPLAIPPALENVDTFQLYVDDHLHQFYPGVNTLTYGVNGDFLGPTLILHKGDTARINVHNELPEMTNMHWHGMLVPGEMDGGPPREVMPGETWNVHYPVKNPASTCWYHPHPHMQTTNQVTLGIAGMIIVRDEEEAALELPRTYGVDDLPVVIQDRRYHGSGSFIPGPFGDSVLVNGIPDAYVDVPAQVVRLRLLNGCNARILELGFNEDQPFHIIGSDGGLLPAPVEATRVRLSNGERAEVLLDLSGLEGDSLDLISYGSELPPTMPGSNYILWEYSYLSGIDFRVLRLRVGAPTAEPVTTVPATLVDIPGPQLADVSRTRIKSLSGVGMVGMGTFYINGLLFDEDVVNDTVQLGATELWTVENASDIAHPFHMHGVSFRIIERNFLPPPEWERGPKDMALIDMAENVKILVKFEERTDGWPFMYHCHNLLHEDNMMMLQFAVEEGSTGTVDEADAGTLRVFPSPTTGPLRYEAPFAAEELLLCDMAGRRVLQRTVRTAEQGELDLHGLPPGAYVLQLRSGDRQARAVVVKE